MCTYKSPIILFSIVLLLISCSNSSDIQYVNNSPELFIDSINTQSIELPTILSMTDEKFDSLNYIIDSKNEEYVYKLFFNRKDVDTLTIFDAIGFSVFKEGDLDGDGKEEIGILYAYPTSSCRIYDVYSIKNSKWNLLFQTNTHLPDRSIGVDYFLFDGSKLRIISANRDSCCQCLGLDTSYVKMANKIKQFNK